MIGKVAVYIEGLPLPQVDEPDKITPAR